MPNVGFEFYQKGIDNSDDFYDVYDEYLKWNRRQLAQIVNAKLYFIALNAMKTTKAATAEGIRNELRRPADKYPTKTIGEILTLMDLKKRGKMPKRTQTLAKNMAKYVQRFENKRASHINFLRSGWLPAIKKLDYWNRKGDSEDFSFVRRFAPKVNMQGIKQFGQDKGRIIPARLDQSRVKGTIFNDVGTGIQDSSTAKTIKQEGLDKAVLQELRSMRVYIEKKQLEHHQKMESRSGGGISTH